jgi:oligopeptide/dipeptide ABC transporter ATP-binding protein
MDLQHDFDLTYLFIAHDLAVVEQVNHRVMVMYLGQIAEMAPSDQLYARPRHPYTAALLSAVPIPDPDVSDRRHQIVLTGDIPSPTAPPPGCRFHNALSASRTEVPAGCPAAAAGARGRAQHDTACYVPLANGEQLRELSAGTGGQR